MVAADRKPDENKGEGGHQDRPKPAHEKNIAVLLRDRAAATLGVDADGKSLGVPPGGERSLFVEASALLSVRSRGDHVAAVECEPQATAAVRLLLARLGQQRIAGDERCDRATARALQPELHGTLGPVAEAHHRERKPSTRKIDLVRKRSFLGEGTKMGAKRAAARVEDREFLERVGGKHRAPH